MECKYTCCHLNVKPKESANLDDAEYLSKLRHAQSPISICVKKCPSLSTLKPLQFKSYWDNKSTAKITNTGSTAYFTFESSDLTELPRLSGGPLVGEYVFAQMHFHWSFDDYTGCEHVVDGHGYAGECHFVHFNKKYQTIDEAVNHADGLAVVGFLFECTETALPKFSRLGEGLDGIKKKGQEVRLPADSIAWIEDYTRGNYVTYNGSLTTPPFTECVTWILYTEPVRIGEEQLDLFRQLEAEDNVLIERNVRPTQRYPPGHPVIHVQQIQSKL